VFYIYKYILIIYKINKEKREKLREGEKDGRKLGRWE
jgi:hypothetical protein